MDEPLFKHFGSDKMIPLIKLLSMKESESIEHSYLTESIIKGQEKIAEKMIVEQSANSQGEWMERNLNAPVPKGELKLLQHLLPDPLLNLQVTCCPSKHFV